MRTPQNTAQKRHHHLVNLAETTRQIDMIADLLAIEGASPLLTHSYRRIALKLKEIPSRSMADAEFDRLIAKMPGIGQDIQAKVRAIAHGEHPNFVDVLGKVFPPSLTSLLLLPNLGPRRVNLLFNELGICSIEQLEAAAAAGKLRALPSFGPALEQRLLATISRRKKSLTEARGAANDFQVNMPAWMCKTSRPN